ncbi:MAG: hypothetical protein EXS05_03380 [Planctomycetaceae bacterium]|nr:hypothetical protein [Planctomycetaceae bacterium]
MYQPVLGAFLSRDPLPADGQPVLMGRARGAQTPPNMGVTLYAYVSNNPLRRTDPSGLSYEKGAGAPAAPRNKNPNSPSLRGPCGCKPGVSIKLFCRKMPAAFNTLFLHCYLAITDENGTYIETISGVAEKDEYWDRGKLVGGDWNWDLGHLIKDPVVVAEGGDTGDSEYPFDTGDMNACDFYDCAMQALDKLGGNLGKYNQYFNNSNTLLTALIQKCGGNANFPWAAWGSDDVGIYGGDPQSDPGGYIL